jgi:hypothetical protein
VPVVPPPVPEAAVFGVITGDSDAEVKDFEKRAERIRMRKVVAVGAPAFVAMKAVSLEGILTMSFVVVASEARTKIAGLPVRWKTTVLRL